MNTIKLKKNALFNPEGDTDLRHRRMIGGNTTNLMISIICATNGLVTGIVRL